MGILKHVGDAIRTVHHHFISGGNHEAIPQAAVAICHGNAQIAALRHHADIPPAQLCGSRRTIGPAPLGYVQVSNAIGAQEPNTLFVAYALNPFL
ncbi:hypothetical protein SDC9_189110 [bioreactor metagenome]|uniref:Uncharacterized protein n=1 Tax=bioreactor metagenome TaxID=1076179 RepID=A0A645HRH6_9ZZZZ